MNKKFISDKIKKKTIARLASVQATYMIEYGNLPVDEVIKDFIDGKVGRFAIDENVDKDVEELLEISELDTTYFQEIVKGVHTNKEEIEKSIAKYLTGELNFERFDGTLRAILLCSAYELVFTTEIDSKVLIKEYVDLAYAFFNKKEPKMVNAILDLIAKNVR